MKRTSDDRPSFIPDDKDAPPPFPSLPPITTGIERDLGRAGVANCVAVAGEQRAWFWGCVAKRQRALGCA
jgi:hypothetical protein